MGGVVVSEVEVVAVVTEEAMVGEGDVVEQRRQYTTYSSVHLLTVVKAAGRVAGGPAKQPGGAEN